MRKMHVLLCLLMLNQSHKVLSQNKLSSSDSIRITRLPVPAGSNIVAGSGLDRISREVKEKCTEVTMHARRNERSVSYSIDQIVSIEHFFKELDIISDETFEKVLGNKAKFFKSIDYNNFSLFILAQTKIKTGSLGVDSASLNQSAIATLKNEPQSFGVKCGDLYAKNIIYGGELIAIYKIKVESEEEKQKILSELDSSFKNFIFQSEYLNALERISSQAKTGVKIFQQGGPTTSFGSSLTPEQFLSLAEKFNDSVTDDTEVALFADFQDYTTLNNFPRGLDIVSLGHAQYVMSELNRIQQQVRKSRTEANFVLSNLGDFADPDPMGLQLKIRQLDTLENEINLRKQRCLQDINDCDISGLYGITVELPPRINKAITQAEAREALRRILGKLGSVKPMNYRHNGKLWDGINAKAISLLRNEGRFDDDVEELLEYLADLKDVQINFTEWRTVSLQCDSELINIEKPYIERLVSLVITLSTIKPKHTNKLEWKIIRETSERLLAGPLKKGISKS